MFTALAESLSFRGAIFMIATVLGVAISLAGRRGRAEALDPTRSPARSEANGSQGAERFTEGRASAARGLTRGWMR